MKLVLAMSLPALELLMDEYIAQRGDADDNQLLRQLVLSDFIEWVGKQQREETTNAKFDIDTRANGLSEQVQ